MKWRNDVGVEMTERNCGDKTGKSRSHTHDRCWIALTGMKWIENKAENKTTAIDTFNFTYCMSNSNKLQQKSIISKSVKIKIDTLSFKM